MDTNFCPTSHRDIERVIQNISVTGFYKLNKFKVFLLLYFKQNMPVSLSLLLIAFTNISIAFESFHLLSSV